MPARKKGDQEDNGKADAILIAEYGRRRLTGGREAA
jgi:hypothetical protein